MPLTKSIPASVSQIDILGDGIVFNNDGLHTRYLERKKLGLVCDYGIISGNRYTFAGCTVVDDRLLTVKQVRNMYVVVVNDSIIKVFRYR